MSGARSGSQVWDYRVPPAVVYQLVCATASDAAIVANSGNRDKLMDLYTQLERCGYAFVKLERLAVAVTAADGAGGAVASKEEAAWAVHAADAALGDLGGRHWEGEEEGETGT